jgi:hypothetical protein
MHMPKGAAPLLLCLGMLAACAARNAPVQHPSAEASGVTCNAGAPPRQYRELTWNEYYAGIVQEASRKGAMVVWVNPPSVVTRASAPTHHDRADDGPGCGEARPRGVSTPAK